jgi:hypothetical protein
MSKRKKAESAPGQRRSQQIKTKGNAEQLPQQQTLDKLAHQIRAEHEGVLLHMRLGIEHAVSAGNLLIEAKDLAGHGNWLPWLEERCQMSERTAQLYMRLARHASELEANPQWTADLTMTEAVALIAKPDADEGISDPERR